MNGMEAAAALAGIGSIPLLVGGLFYLTEPNRTAWWTVVTGAALMTPLIVRLLVLAVLS